MKSRTTIWRQIQRQNFSRIEELVDFLQLSEKQKEQVISFRKFPLNLPQRLAAKIEKGNINDPIFLQFVPLAAEEQVAHGFSCDPLMEEEFRKAPKLLHKYQGRALLVVTQACAMHCRYCFRRHFEYQQEDRLFVQELEIIRNDDSISEILLSGGDPLSLDDVQLEYLLSQLDAIPHIERVRFHTRFPIGIPERISEEFLSIFKNKRIQFVFVIHSNHFNELDPDVFYALKQLQQLGIPILNQSVLLKGVNDDASVLISLYRSLINHGIIPYYIHQLDRVQGAAHFEVSEEEGKAIMQKLAAALPGYAVPRYVREVAGDRHKTPV